VSQADFLADLLTKLNQNCHHVLNLDVPDDVLIKRLLARGRKDDNEETIRNRLQVYRQQTAPLIDYYQKCGLLRQVNGNLPLEEVTKSLENII
jgi:adenylate kinase